MIELIVLCVGFMNKFDSRVLEIIKKVPKGKVTTYKEISRALNTKAYRAVGQALKRNPHPIIVPCHRVVCSDGALGGYGGSGRKGVEKKSKLLRKEGVEMGNGRIELEKYFYKL